MATNQKSGIRSVVFIGCFFIVLGLGLAWRRPDVGALLGLGIGFMLLAFVKIKREPITVKIPHSFVGYLLITVGFFFVILAMGLVFYPQLIYPYLISIFIAFSGLFCILGGSHIIRGDAKQELNGDE